MNYFINPFTLNLYQSGIIKKEKEEVSSITTINNDYNIQLKRNQINSSFNNLFYYFCSFKFINLQLKIVSLELNLNEIEVSILLDNIYQYLESNSSDIIIPFRQYKFTFNKNESKHIMHIYENSLKRISIEFDEDSLLKFVDIIYFSFLIDIPDN